MKTCQQNKALGDSARPCVQPRFARFDHVFLNLDDLHKVIPPATVSVRFHAFCVYQRDQNVPLNTYNVAKRPAITIIHTAVPLVCFIIAPLHCV